MRSVHSEHHVHQDHLSLGLMPIHSTCIVWNNGEGLADTLDLVWLSVTNSSVFTVLWRYIESLDSTLCLLRLAQAEIVPIIPFLPRFIYFGSLALVSHIALTLFFSYTFYNLLSDPLLREENLRISSCGPSQGYMCQQLKWNFIWRSAKKRVLQKES